MDLNKHKFMMMQILRDIFNTPTLAPLLAFKGGTSLMFFYELPRFSVDLDFNLLDPTKEEYVFSSIKRILSRYGKIDDAAMKHFGPLIVLDYGVGERMLKVEVSNRQYNNHYEMKTLMGINMRVMTLPDMFAHKLCALTDRNEVTGRDIFDCWFFLSRRTPINPEIVESRMGMPLSDYLNHCIQLMESTPTKTIMNGLGEVTDGTIKQFAKTKLKTELIDLLRIFQAFPQTI